jgi:hypothetical protein
VFKYFLISIAVIPLLLGVSAAKRRDGGRNGSALRIGWVLYALLWFGVLYYLRYRWS